MRHVVHERVGVSKRLPRLAHGNTGWIHADGYVPVQLPAPDGRTAWWMSDTGTGSVNDDNSAPDSGTVHNSLVLQDTSCLTPKLGGQAWAWSDLIPAPAGQWYWPGSTEIEGNTLLVFAYRVEPANGPAGFDWTILGTTVARYNLPDMTFQSATNLPVQNSPALYGGDAIPWGIRTVDVGGTVYMYGATRRSSLGPGDVWVARAPFAQVTNSGAWEYYTGLSGLAAWNPMFALAQPMTFQGTPQQNQDDIKAPLAQLSVYHYGNKYLASSLSNVLDTRIRAWISDSPEGPWDYQGVVATAAFLSPSTQVAYDARVVDLPGAGWTAVYNVNDPNHNKEDIRLYRGQFATPAAGVLPPPPP